MFTVRIINRLLYFILIVELLQLVNCKSGCECGQQTPCGQAPIPPSGGCTPSPSPPAPPCLENCPTDVADGPEYGYVNLLTGIVMYAEGYNNGSGPYSGLRGIVNGTNNLKLNLIAKIFYNSYIYKLTIQSVNQNNDTWEATYSLYPCGGRDPSYYTAVLDTVAVQYNGTDSFNQVFFFVPEPESCTRIYIDHELEECFVKSRYATYLAVSGVYLAAIRTENELQNFRNLIPSLIPRNFISSNNLIELTANLTVQMVLDLLVDHLNSLRDYLRQYIPLDITRLIDLIYRILRLDPVNYNTPGESDI